MRRKLLRSVALLLCLVAMPGCLLAVGAAGGAGGVVYYKGTLSEYVDYPVNQIYQSTLKVLDSRNLPLYSDTHDSYKAKLTSELLNGKNVWIDIDSVTRGSSEIKIRVGATGDQKEAVLLLEAIKNNLAPARL
jgi:hypothetical protein